MIYRDKHQAQLELEMNERVLAGTKWTITQFERDGVIFYEPIRICPLCGERLKYNQGHRC